MDLACVRRIGRGLCGALALLDLVLTLLAVVFPNTFLSLLQPAALAQPFDLVRRTGALWAFFCVAEAWACLKGESRAEAFFLVGCLRLMDVAADSIWLGTGEGFSRFGSASLVASPLFNFTSGVFLVWLYYRARAEAHINELAVKDRVWATIQALNRAWAVDGDADRLKDYFHRDMVAITATDRLRLEGRDVCIASWKRFVKSAKVTRWQERDPKVQLYCSGKSAVVTYYFEMSIEMDGKKTDLGGRDMFVLIEEDGRWWVVADQFSGFPED